MYCRVKDGDIEIQYVDETYRITMNKQTMIMSKKAFISLGRAIFKIVEAMTVMEKNND